MNYDICPLDTSDLNRINELRPEGWGDLFEVHDRYIRHGYCTPVKVRIEGNLAGVGTGIRFASTAWIAHVIVHPQFQRRGIAACIVTYLRDLLVSEGYSTVSLIATDQGYPVYLKTGFRVQAEYLFYEGLPFGDDILPSGVEPVRENEFEAIHDLDRFVTGEDRSNYIGEDWKTGFIYRGIDGIEGVYLPDVASGLIVARSQAAGEALLLLRLRNHGQAVVPAQNSHAVQILESHGFVRKYLARRMIHGPGFPWHPQLIYNRISGSVG